MFSAFSLTEYKMLHPDTAEYPTLSQNGALAALLQKRRFKLACLAHRQAKRRAREQAVRIWFGRWWTRLRGTAPSNSGPALSAVSARSF